MLFAFVVGFRLGWDLSPLTAGCGGADVLGSLDETLRHQLPTTFDHVGYSDPRFYDRFWFCAYDPEGQIALITSIGLYANMNVMDGFASIQTPDFKQHNIRFSRALRPDMDSVRVGPLSFEVLEPFKRLRLRLEESDYPIGFDLEWLEFTPPVEEDPHFTRSHGRVTQDYTRYTQVGRAQGSISLAGKRYRARNWFAARDHSWGVRPGVGGSEPVTGPPKLDALLDGVLFSWLPFRTESFSGFYQIWENKHGERSYNHGLVQWPAATGKAPLRVEQVDLHFDCYPGTRRWQQARVDLVLEDGQKLEIEARPLLRCWAMCGTGYDSGYLDERGLGVYRGESLAEYDVFDLSHPEKIVRGDGTPPAHPALHRETPARLTVNGEPALGHMIIMPLGPLPRYGFEDCWPLPTPAGS